MMHHFNVYLVDSTWTWVDEFWSATSWNLPIGGIMVAPAGAMYDKAVRIKRMS